MCIVCVHLIEIYTRFFAIQPHCAKTEEKGKNEHSVSLNNAHARTQENEMEGRESIKIVIFRSILANAHVLFSHFLL